MAAAYQACSAALDKLGEPEAAWIAADRAMAAAERAGNPLLVAAGAFRLVFVFMSARHYAQAEETARTAADALWHLADDGSPEAMSLWGALTLQRAITAARTGDADSAYAHLDGPAPWRIGSGSGRNDYNTEFGPANVALFEIAVAVELGDAGGALRTAAALDTSALSAERRARMLIDVARAHAQRRQVAEAVSALRPGRGHHPRAGPRSLPGPPDRLRPAAMQDPPGPELRALSVRLGVSEYVTETKSMCHVFLVRV